MLPDDQMNGLRTGLKEQGYAIQDQFLPEQRCQQILATIAQFRQTTSLPEISRQVRGRSLRYSVIDGEKVEQSLPEIVQIYQDVNAVVRELTGENLVSLTDKKVGVNVNITPKDGVYRWHYDRNAVTALLYLNVVTGGELELYPNYRIYLKNRAHTGLQRSLDAVLQVDPVRNLFGKKVVVKPAQGRLVIMRGNRCLHSVCPVYGDDERINLVLSYDNPDASFLFEKNLNSYLYTQEEVSSSDPNYK
jgi:hypothetical protein